MMFSSSRLIALTTRLPIGQSMWHVQLYPPVIRQFTATQWVNILLLFNFKKECLTCALQNLDISTHAWDVRQETKYLDCLGKTKLLPLKLLSINLAMLFALSCPERASSLAKLISGVCGPRRSFSSHLCL